MGFGGSGALASRMSHMFVHPRGSLARGKVVSGWIIRFPTSIILFGQL